mmetsp:Transcript_21368/g.35761  ORF Transcript_21368/g.35761 Transcript_21368/m.35761 type:complete len:119 (+) Transcript_21368:188-544(+)
MDLWVPTVPYESVPTQQPGQTKQQESMSPTTMLNVRTWVSVIVPLVHVNVEKDSKESLVKGNLVQLNVMELVNVNLCIIMRYQRTQVQEMYIATIPDGMRIKSTAAIVTVNIMASTVV